MRVMYDYKRLVGYCNLCNRMTHAIDHCYKAKKKTAKEDTLEKGKGKPSSKNKNYKGALLTGKNVNAANVKETTKVGINDCGTTLRKQKRGVGRSNDFEVVPMETESDQTGIEARTEDEASGSGSTKKVRRPLFVEEMSNRGKTVDLAKVGEDNVQSSEVPMIAGKTKGKGISMTAPEQGDVSMDTMDTYSGKEQMETNQEGESEDNGEEPWETITKAAETIVSQQLTIPEINEIYEDANWKANQTREKRAAKTPPGPSKPTSRPSTPPCGTTAKKMLMTGMTSLRQAKKAESSGDKA